MLVKDFDTYEEMSEKAVEETLRLLGGSSKSYAKFTIALSGGSSPAGFYSRLASLDVDWSKVCFFVVDERKVRPENENSNIRMIRETLLSKIDIPGKNIFPVNVSYRKVEDSALMYEEKIKAFFNGGNVVFDLVILGIGPDGHTASLFPGRSELKEINRFVIPAYAPDRFKVKERITMTFPLINKALNRFFIVSGKEKLSIVKGVLAGDSLYPASYVNSDSMLFTDFRIKA